MRLIDADLLLEHNGMSQDCRTCQHSTYRCGNDRKYTLMEFCERIDYEETVDAVPVVRCRDCLYYREGLCYLHTELCTNKRGYKGEVACVEREDFCSYGERKDNERG